MKNLNGKALLHWTLLIAVSALFGLVSCHAHAQEFPKPKGYMNDFAHILSEDEAVKLEVELAKFDARMGVEIAVVSVKSLNGYSVEEYTKRLSNAWGVGKKSANNGIMFLVAPSERKIRIAVGDGLTAQFSDGEVKRIIENEVVPRFRKNQLNEGLVAGARSIMSVLTEERASSVQAPKRSEDKAPVYIMGGIFAALLLSFGGTMIIGAIYDRRKERKETEELLASLPAHLKKARAAVNRDDVGDRAKELFSKASELFEEATQKPTLLTRYGILKKLRDASSAANRAEMAAESDRKQAAVAREKGPELFAKLPEQFAAAKEKAAGDEQKLQRIASDEMKYHDLRASSVSGLVPDWVVWYVVLSAMSSHCESVVNPEPPRSSGDDGRRSSYDSDSTSSSSFPSFSGGSMGDGGASGGW